MNIQIKSTEPQTPAAREFLANPEKRMLINGTWVESINKKRFDTLDPATGNVLAALPEGTREDVDEAVKAARIANEIGTWRNLTPEHRSRIMWKIGELIDDNIEELAELETLDQGKPLAVGRWAEIPGAAQQFRYFAGLATKIEGVTITPSITYHPEGKRLHAYTAKEPIGVVAAITPWNSPLIMHAMKLAPALAAGCCVVLKPAEDTSLTAIRLGELILEAGVPPGVVNIVTGYGPVVGAALASHEGVDKVAFTGSTATGRSILDASKGNLKKVTLELGGKSPMIVLDDADLNLAIPALANAIFFNGGQVCVAGTRLYVQSKIYDHVIEGIANIAKDLKLGHGLDPDTQLGPLVSQKQSDRVFNYVQSGISDGAELVTGGEQVGDYRTFITPTVLSDAKHTMEIVKEEIFGPVLACMKFDTIEDAVLLANDSSYGLAASVWTESLSSAHRLAADIRAGTVWINGHLLFDPSLPIGGYKESGWGRESGLLAVENYLETKTVCAVV